MRVVPFHLQGKGVLDLDVAADFSGLVPAKWKKEGLFGSTEPTSVLEQRRSPSPQTSTSILSTSLGGSSGSTDTAGVAAVSGNPLHQWPPSQDDNSAGAAAAGTDGGRKEAWAPELQPVPTPLEMSSAGGGGEKCGAGGGGFGMEEWENMLSESSEVSPGNDHSFFRWFMGDVDDPSLKQLLQTGGGGPSEFEGGVPGYCVAEPGLGFEGGVSAPGNVNLSSIAPPLAASTAATDFALNTSNPLSNLKSHFFGGNNNNTPQNPIFSAATSNALPLSLPLSLPQGAFYHQQQQQFEGIDEKPQLFNLQNQQQANPPPPPPHHHQNPAFLLPFSYAQQEQQHLLPPQPKRHHPTVVDPSCQFPKIPLADSGQELLLQRPPPQSFVNEHLIPDHLQKRQAKMKVVGSLENGNQQALVDQLYKAAELVESGNFGHAREILARLNHQLSHVGKPLQRAAFYFKEALQLLLKTATTPGCNNTLASSASPLDPLDVVFKISAYKFFSEISPFLQFVNFTSNQVLLEALDGFDRIHIIDFDIGIGGQWASFMQELAMRLGGTPTLKITAFASPSSHHPLELSLTQENLTHFANSLNISFQFNVINIDAIDTSTIMSLGASAILNLSDNEAIAVNFPVGSSNLPIPLLLRIVKQVSPKIVVSVDHGCVRSDFPFPQHFLHALQSYSVLFDSLDAVNVNSEAVYKIERSLLQPRIESVVLGRHQAGEKMLPWRALFNSAGFSPLPFSNFTETQGEYMVRRLQGRGFHVEKRQASLYLCWQSGELCSVSAWRC